MVWIRNSVCLYLAVALIGCVAPEDPPAPRQSPSAATKPAVSTAGYEDAPLPNRKLGAPAPDTVIRIAH